MSEQPPKRVDLDRAELHRQVWATPKRLSAREYGLSDVGLAKICKKHDIPRPGSSHWAKRQAGRAPRTKVLPACNDPRLQTITLYLGRREPWVEPQVFDEEILRLLDRARALPTIEVPPRLPSRPHPLVAITRDALRESKPDCRYHLVSPRWELRDKSLNVELGPANVPRGLRFLNTLLRSIESLGGTIETEERRRNRQRFTVVSFAGEEAATIRVREHCKQSVKPPDKDRSVSWREYEYTPTGAIVLDAGPGYVELEHCRDTKKRKIEVQINELVLWWIRKVG